MAGAGGEVGLPTAKVSRADPVDRLLAKPGPHIEPQATLGNGQGSGTAVGIGGPDLPPLFGPPAEREPAALEPLPGTLGNPQPLPGDQVARLLLAAHRRGALGAVVQQPPHLIGHAAGASADALADAYRRHRPRPPTSRQRSHLGIWPADCPTLGQVQARPSAVSRPVRDSGSLAAHGRLLAARSHGRWMSAWPGTAGAILVG